MARPDSKKRTMGQMTGAQPAKPDSKQMKGTKRGYLPGKMLTLATINNSSKQK